jgi:hypothetical protein
MLDWVAPARAATRVLHSSIRPCAEWLAPIAIALRVPGKLDWDSKNQRITNNAEANKYVSPCFARLN